LSANGWGLIPLYLGAQTVDVHGHPVAPPADPAAAAATDAAHALALAAQANLPANTTLFFDIEDGTTPAGLYDTYLLAWAAAITAGGYTPAFYCSHLVAPWAQANGFAVWSFHVYNTTPQVLDPAALPADPVDPNCLGTQTRQGVTITGLTGANTKPLVIDYSVFTIPNPAASTATS